MCNEFHAHISFASCPMPVFTDLLFMLRLSMHFSASHYECLCLTMENPQLAYSRHHNLCRLQIFAEKCDKGELDLTKLPWNPISDEH